MSISRVEFVPGDRVVFRPESDPKQWLPRGVELGKESWRSAEDLEIGSEHIVKSFRKGTGLEVLLSNGFFYESKHFVLKEEDMQTGFTEEPEVDKPELVEDRREFKPGDRVVFSPGSDIRDWKFYGTGDGCDSWEGASPLVPGETYVICDYEPKNIDLTIRIGEWWYKPKHFFLIPKVQTEESVNTVTNETNNQTSAQKFVVAMSVYFAILQHLRRSRRVREQPSL